MALLEVLNSVKMNQGVAAPRLLPVDGIDDSNWEMIVIADGTDNWQDMTGKHTLTVRGTPALISGQIGFIGTKDDYLESDFKETDWDADQDFVAVTLGRFVQDDTYSTVSLMGSISGSDPTDFRGFSMGLQRFTSPTTGIRNTMSVSRVRSGTEFRQALFPSHSEAIADVSRYRLQIMRVRHVARTIESFAFDGYDGTGALNVESFTFLSTDTLTGRLQANTNICFGTHNGYTGSDQCQFVMGALYKGDVSDEQIRNLANSIRAQFSSTKTIDGEAVSGGISALRGMTPFDLYTPALT